MAQTSEEVSYSKAAEQFLKKYYDSHTADNLFFSYGFKRRVVEEAVEIAKSIDVKKKNMENALVATWFAFTGIRDISDKQPQIAVNLLSDFFAEVNYPQEERAVVESAIAVAVENKFAETKVEKIVSDALNSYLAWPDLMENIILVKEEANRLSGEDRDEMFYLAYFRDLFLKRRFYTKYTAEKYSVHREKNFEQLEKRIRKLETFEKSNSEIPDNFQPDHVLSSKETEDLFKIAFRNYNHLISVADSKAALLIHVNSIIISVVLGLILRWIPKNHFLLIPAIPLFLICLGTIFLSIMASRPQKNTLSENKDSTTYQRFFFGSFDLVDRSFRRVKWEDYYKQLHNLFIDSKESVYTEVFKETFNVRKVLARKFNYLSIAYWVFMIGLIVSVLLFIVTIYDNPITT